VRTVEPLGEPNPDPLGLPDMALMLTDALVVFDHLKHTVTILANADLDAEPDIERAYAQARETIAEVRARLAGPVPRRSRPAAQRPGQIRAFRVEHAARAVRGMVARIIEYIYAGDAFQVVPSQRWSAPVPVEAFSIYRGLRAVNPSPYMYFLDFGDFQVAGASPEPLITVTGRRSRRGRSPAPARAARAPRRTGGSREELLADEKERAEHVMLVDLGPQRPRAGVRVRQREGRRASWRSRTTAT
jgi:anthranilate synthase component 1